MAENKNNMLKSRIYGRECPLLLRLTEMKKSKYSCITYINTWDYFQTVSRDSSIPNQWT